METSQKPEDREQNNLNASVVQTLITAIIANQSHYNRATFLCKKIPDKSDPGKYIIGIPLLYILYLVLVDFFKDTESNKSNKRKRKEAKLTQDINIFLSQYSQHELINSFKQSRSVCLLLGTTNHYYDFPDLVQPVRIPLFNYHDPTPEQAFPELKQRILHLDPRIFDLIRKILQNYQGLQATPSNQAFLPQSETDPDETAPTIDSVESPEKASPTKENAPEHRYRTIIRLIHDVEGRYVENLQAEKDKEAESKKNFYYSIYVPHARKLILVSSGVGRTFICHNVAEDNISEYQTKTTQGLKEDLQVNSFTWKEEENLKTTFEANYAAPIAKQEAVPSSDTFEAHNPNSIKATMEAFVTAYNSASPNQRYTVFDLRPYTKMPVGEDHVRHTVTIKIGDDTLPLDKFFKLMCQHLHIDTSNPTRQKQKTRVRKNIVEPILKYAGFKILDQEYFENTENIQADLKSIFALLFPEEEWNEATSPTRIRTSMNIHRTSSGASKKFRATNGQDISPERYRTRYKEAMNADLFSSATSTSPQ